MNHITSIRAMAVALCFLLLVLSFLWISINSYAAPAQSTVDNTATTLLIKGSATSPVTPTPSPTATPTLSPTATPTPSPTATKTPRPTATPTTPPTATPTAFSKATPTTLPTSIPGVTATPTTGIATTPTTKSGPIATHTLPTPSTSITQTPVTTSKNNSSINNRKGNSNTSSSSNAQSHFALPPLPLIISALLLAGLACASLLGITLLRRDLSPLPAGKQHLPPSGAQPWSRTRTDDLDDELSLHDDLLFNDTPTLAPIAEAIDNRPILSSFSSMPVSDAANIHWQPSIHSVQTEAFPTQNIMQLSPANSLPITPFSSTQAIENTDMASLPSTPRPSSTEQVLAPSPPTSVASTRPMRRSVKLKSIEPQ